jgi:hypothetical protein
MVNRFSAAPQQYMQAPIPESRLFPRQLHQPHPQPFIAPLALIAVAGYRHRHQAAGSPLAEGILLPHLPHSRLQDCELHPFFRITDCNASLSRLRSATSFRSRVFSSRNCFASCASLTSIPPYFAFQVDLWAYQNGVRMEFSRPGKPTDNAFVESFNGTF